jgi:hypothetical protein
MVLILGVIFACQQNQVSILFHEIYHVMIMSLM